MVRRSRFTVFSTRSSSAGGFGAAALALRGAGASEAGPECALGSAATEASLVGGQSSSGT